MTRSKDASEYIFLTLLLGAAMGAVGIGAMCLALGIEMLKALF